MNYHCKTHGGWNPSIASGCPDCIVDARKRIAQLERHRALLRDAVVKFRGESTRHEMLRILDRSKNSFGDHVRKADAARSTNPLDYCTSCRLVSPTSETDPRSSVQLCIRHAAMSRVIKRMKADQSAIKEVYDRVYDERQKLQSEVSDFLQRAFAIKNSESVDAGLRQCVLDFSHNINNLLPLPEGSAVLQVLMKAAEDADRH
jgi:hypothetical protein